MCGGCGPTAQEQTLTICERYNKTLDWQPAQLIKAPPECNSALGVSPLLAMENPIAKGKIFLTPECEHFAEVLTQYDQTEADQRRCLRFAGVP
jgi:hypothetical protein